MWSPALKKSGQELSYWRQRLKTNGLLTEGARDLGNRLNLSITVQQTLSVPVCKFYLEVAWKSYNGIKKQAREHRIFF